MNNSLTSQLETLIAPEVQKLGYELLDLEYQKEAGGFILRLFIDHTDGGQAITFDDCVKVDHGLDSLFEAPAFTTVLSGAFTLEVSSPGIDRPIKKPSDFERFAGKKALIKTFRPLTLEEMGNPKYFEHHQKQKNFSGTLRNLSGESVELETDKQIFKIPLALIAKANLDISSQLVADTD